MKKLNFEIMDAQSQSLYSPPVDFYEDLDCYFLIIELPGLNEEEIKVKIENNELTISGTKKTDQFSKYKTVRSERAFGPFIRKMKLGFKLKENMIEKTYIDGILKLKITKKG
ncbi:MAG: Hsp20/alpha crystallin family protein [Pseudomonadota bacterium]